MSLLQGEVVAAPNEHYLEHKLFGGAITSTFPLRLGDVSAVREVPDHQEVFVDPSRDESLIFELVEYRTDVQDDKSAFWFLHDLAQHDDAENVVVDALKGQEWLSSRAVPFFTTIAVGQMDISKGRQGRDAQNRVKVYLANLRLKEVATDVLIVAYEPIIINPRSESAVAVGAGFAVPATQAGYMTVEKFFRLAVSTFQVKDWSLFSAT